MKQSLILRNGRIITPYRIIEGDIHIVDGIIERISAPGDADPRESHVVDVGSSYISPGFIDLHVHGGGGADFMDGTVEAFTTAARIHLRHGTTSMMPTTLSGSIEDTKRSIEAYRESKDVSGMPHLLGMHLEGPYFSQEQRGAQDPRYIRNPDPNEYLPLLETYSDIRRWSLAPELPGGLEMGRALVERGVIASIAHTNTDYNTILCAMEYGFSLPTHMYSGMSGVFRKHAYRYAGVIESGYLIDDLPVEVIADGKHLPVSLLRLIHKVKGSANMCLVSDSLRATGLGEGEFLLGANETGQRIVVEDGVAKLPDRSAFAGSVASGIQLVRTMHVEVEVPLAEAVRMMTVNPARIVGLADRKGKIAPGYDADLVVFDGDFTVKQVVVSGTIV
ncbi:MAG: N-acetylglucosamine-6-phosphate deacetylase [Sphaerochaetaceae bacterium]